MKRGGAPAQVRRAPGLPWSHSLLILTLAPVLLQPDARAGESLYVVEQLVLGVSSAPGGAERVATIKSGERVERLERQGDEAHIQLPTGASGWVKATYLSAELPLQQRLQDRTAEVERLRQDIG